MMKSCMEIIEGCDNELFLGLVTKVSYSPNVRSRACFPTSSCALFLVKCDVSMFGYVAGFRPYRRHWRTSLPYRNMWCIHVASGAQMALHELSCFSISGDDAAICLILHDFIDVSAIARYFNEGSDISAVSRA